MVVTRFLAVGEGQDPSPEWGYANNAFMGCICPGHFATLGFFPKARLSRTVCQNKHPHTGIALHFCHHTAAVWGCRLPDTMASHAAFTPPAVHNGQQSPSCKKETAWGLRTFCSGSLCVLMLMCACSLLPLLVQLDYCTLQSHLCDAAEGMFNDFPWPKALLFYSVLLLLGFLACVLACCLSNPVSQYFCLLKDCFILNILPVKLLKVSRGLLSEDSFCKSELAS